MEHSKKMKMKNILVTGGAGFIGSNIVKSLRDSGHKIVVFDNFSRGKNKNIKNISFINGDVRDREKVFKILKNIDSVVHLAFINGTKNFYKHPTEVLDVGVKGMVNIVDGCIKNNIKELILASSSEVYQTPLKVPTNENEPLKIPDVYNPRYSYAAGKILTEIIGINFGKKFFKKLIIFRPHNVYGPNMGNDHVIPEIIKKITKLKKNEKFIKIKSNGQEVRSFIHIDDFVDAFKLIFDKGKHLQIYNIGTQEKIKIFNLIKLIKNKLKRKFYIKKSKAFYGNTNIRCPDIKKIVQLGFKAKINLNQGLDMLIKNLKFNN
jgi:nucleoside-diphosphate-sugar epimerase